MTIIRRSGPFSDLVSLRQAMDRLFEESFVGPRSWASEDQIVPMDVYASDDEVRVQAILPGVKPEDLDITVEGSTLTISGNATQTNADMDGSLVLQEIRRGRFVRTLSLPAGLEPDKATATFEDGVLTLRIPKAEALRPRQIKITSGLGAVGGRDQVSDGERDQSSRVAAK